MVSQGRSAHHPAAYAEFREPTPEPEDAMPNQIARWKAEHADYRKLLDLLETQTERFAGGERRDYDLMAGTVYYITQYPDRAHFPREGIAFTTLLAHDPTMRASIEYLDWEHQAIERSGATLAAD